MACPHLREIVMLFCDAYPSKKMLPLDRIVSAEPCLGQFASCPVFQELMARLPADDTADAADARTGTKARTEVPR